MGPLLMMSSCVDDIMMVTKLYFLSLTFGNLTSNQHIRGHVTMTTETDLQAERSVGESSGGSAEQSSWTRQVETRPAEVLQLVRREEFRGGTSRVVNVIVLQQLRQTHGYFIELQLAPTLQIAFDRVKVDRLLLVDLRWTE